MGRVEVAGGIASGKTTFSGLFRACPFVIVYENFQENPFWQLFYRDPERYAFETEITFLLQHYSQVRDATSPNAQVVLDTSFVVDLSYADINLSGAEYDAFKSVYEVVQRSLDPLDHLIWLRCGEAEQLRRIRARGREEETTITIDYLRDLDNAIARRVKEIEGRVNLIEIDSERLDFAFDSQAKQVVIQKVITEIGFEPADDPQ